MLASIQVAASGGSATLTSAPSLAPTSAPSTKATSPAARAAHGGVQGTAAHRTTGDGRSWTSTGTDAGTGGGTGTAAQKVAGRGLAVGRPTPQITTIGVNQTGEPRGGHSLIFHAALLRYSTKSFRKSPRTTRRRRRARASSDSKAATETSKIAAASAAGNS